MRRDAAGGRPRVPLQAGLLRREARTGRPHGGGARPAVRGDRPGARHGVRRAAAGVPPRGGARPALRQRLAAVGQQRAAAGLRGYARASSLPWLGVQGRCHGEGVDVLGRLHRDLRGRLRPGVAPSAAGALRGAGDRVLRQADRLGVRARRTWGLRGARRRGGITVAPGRPGARHGRVRRGGRRGPEARGRRHRSTGGVRDRGARR